MDETNETIIGQFLAVTYAVVFHYSLEVYFDFSCTTLKKLNKDELQIVKQVKMEFKFGEMERGQSILPSL